MSVSNEELISNIKRQAKRFSKSLSIPLGQAQEGISIVVYDCVGWGHLLSSLKSKSLENELLLIAALHPKSDKFLFKLLENNMRDIISRFKVKFNSYEGNDEIEKIIVKNFGIEPTDFERKVK